MPALRKDLRRELENVVKAARRIGEAGAREALDALAVGEKEPFAHMKGDATALSLRNQLRARGRSAGDQRDANSGRQTVQHLVGVVAYEHWHRMLFARFLAENGLLLEPGGVAVSLADVEELAREEKVDVWELAGSYAKDMLPQIFRSDDPALALALPREVRVKLEKLLADLPREVFAADDSLGWVYQFWRAEEKKAADDSNAKIDADTLSAVTQLFTENYMVEFLLHNTLGAWWTAKIEATGRTSSVPLRYLRRKEDGTPAAGAFPGWPRTVRELRILDPCCGSGHFLVALLQLLVSMLNEEEGLGAEEANRLRNLLVSAFGTFDERQILAAAGAKAKNLEDWLRDEFFERHCKLFHDRPFVWHLWDGRSEPATIDGFAGRDLDATKYRILQRRN